MGILLTAFLFALVTMPVHSSAREKDLSEFLVSPVTGAAVLYRKWISPAKGFHCKMMPSDSAYMREAIHTAGPFMGLLMTADRLHRCGHDVSRYPVVMTPSGPRLWDPVPPQHLPH